MYRRLEPEKIVETVEKLVKRIDERFPRSGLSKVCQELLVIARDSKERAEWIAKPHLALRIAIGILIALIIVSLLYLFARLTLPRSGFDLVNVVQFSEAGLNILIILGAVILFLITVESRIKRARALKALHELRSLAHVIDMHQLTKDPDRFLQRSEQTASSPKLNLTPSELSRYLDYCSEMLSLTGKIAALYVQKFGDPVALAAVEDIETLTTGLTSKIWQKITILNSLTARHEAPLLKSQPRA